MRNLYLNAVKQVPARGQCVGGVQMSLDYDSGAVYIATDTSIIAVDPDAGQVIHELDLCAQGALDGTHRRPGVVGLQHMAEEMAVCVATETGDLHMWNLLTGELECVGSVSHGFTAMGFSPDQELVILTTGQGTLIMMTREFDALSETSLYPQEFGEAAFINVGWGKKTTQFHGSAGKQAAVNTKQDVKPVSSWDDRRPRITWRGDGQYFAVSSISPVTGSRQFRVWTREGALHSTGENVAGLEQALSWKPSGSLIASSQRKPNKHDIVFFELNGLQHGEFTLPFDTNEIKVKEISWNTESTVLAVWCEELPQEGADRFKPKSYVQMWTVNNYHWYLKQSLQFDATEQDRVALMLWDPEHAYRIHILCEGGQYLQYTYSWVTDSSRNASVSVIDGDKVLVTPFNKMVVPPPMSAYTIQLPCAVNQIIYAPPPNNNDMALLLSNGSVAIYIFQTDCGEKCDPDKTVQVTGAGGKGFTVNTVTPRLKGIYQIDMAETQHYPLVFNHFLWINKSKILFCMNQMTGCGSVLCSLDVTENVMKLGCRVEVESRVFSLCRSHDSDTVVIQTVDGALLQYSSDENSLVPMETSSGREVRFPQQCTQMNVCLIGGEEAVLGLTDRYRFYVNDTEVASNCTSFSVHDEFLLLTTHAHTCRCICRKTKISVLPTLSDGKAHPFDESVRRVERGSRLVTSVAQDTLVVLQMPRGNLEVIHPRALVLAVVRRLLDSLEYSKAFALMRKHRINMNLIHDHDPQTFINNTHVFIRQLHEAQHVSLFLTDLQEDDVTVTMYTAAYNRSKVIHDAPSGNKVDQVCSAVRNVLENVDPDKYLLSILTSYVKQSNPDLETALLRIQSLKDAGSPRAEEALRYLLFLVDVNELYDVALGTYDFQLVLMVAEKSQKDPKEYLPFLNNLRKMEVNYQKYHIDKHLKRYSRALHNIAKCGEERFDECLSLVKDHRLYTEAMTLFPKATKHYMSVATSFADYLTEKKWHEEAGILYSKAGEWQCALDSFEKCLCWRQVFCMASKLGYCTERISELGRKLTARLKDNQRYTEASLILDQYVGDAEEAIVTLIQGGLWQDSLSLMYKHNRLDFIETDLKSSIVEKCASDLDTIKSMEIEFEHHKNRLSVVRQEKEQKRLDLLEGTGNFNDADGDLFSDTSSATGESIQSSKYSSASRNTIRTKVSGKSSKNRKKSDRKKWSLKEGSMYEDLALIEALSNIVTRAEQMKCELTELLKVLVMFDYEPQAGDLQCAMESFLTVIESSLADIWDPTADTFNPTPTFGPDTTANAIALALQQGSQPRNDPQLDPSLRVAPTINHNVQWKLHQLERSYSKR